jgi:hypothetical protein
MEYPRISGIFRHSKRDKEGSDKRGDKPKAKHKPAAIPDDQRSTVSNNAHAPEKNKDGELLTKSS